MTAIATEALGRTYKTKDGRERRALDAVTLGIEEGEVRGLLGPNGAGKTTLVRILSTVLLPSEGRASVLGRDVAREPQAVRRLIGIVFGGDRGLYPKLTARQTLEFWAALYKVAAEETRRRVPALLERVGLATRADERVETYSRGMKQRLHLARGLIGNPRVLFLDEPTIGMDPLAARDFRVLIKELKSEGRTILLTTHDMAEAAVVCDRVALIDRGRLLTVETPDGLARLVSNYERIDFEGPATVAGRIGALAGVVAVRAAAAGCYRVEIAEPGAAGRVLEELVAAGVTNLQTSRPSLEEVYIHLIGDRSLRV
jgi:ABC-2 type transport system ATP-binding protein